MTDRERVAIEAEREACTKVCEAAQDTGNDKGVERDVVVWNMAVAYCVRRIRMRSNFTGRIQMNNGTECTPTRDSEVRQELEKLEKVIKEILQSIMSMRTKFGSVLRTPRPCAITAVKETKDIVPLAANIRQSFIKLTDCKNEMQQIIRDCQL